MRVGSDFFKKNNLLHLLAYQKDVCFLPLKRSFQDVELKIFFAFVKKNTTFAFPNGGCHSSVGRAKD